MQMPQVFHMVIRILPADKHIILEDVNSRQIID